MDAGQTQKRKIEITQEDIAKGAEYCDAQAEQARKHCGPGFARASLAKAKACREIERDKAGNPVYRVSRFDRSGKLVEYKMTVPMD